MRISDWSSDVCSSDLPTAQSFISVVLERFAEVYRRTYGYSDASTIVEGVDWQLTAMGEQSASAGSSDLPNGGRSVTAVTRPAYFPECGGFTDCPVHLRRAMTSGQIIPGPAIIEEPESTTVVPPGCDAMISENGHLIVIIKTENRS